MLETLANQPDKTETEESNSSILGSGHREKGIKTDA